MTSLADKYAGMAILDPPPSLPTSLYHTLLEVVDLEASPAGAIRTLYPLATHTTLSAAKAFTYNALPYLGYTRGDFEVYEEKLPSSTSSEALHHTFGPAVPRPPTPDQDWPHGDGTLVYAKRTGPHEFLVRLVTTPNDAELLGSEDGRAHIQLPDGRTGSDLLHFVLQTTVDYNADRSGGRQSTDVVGVFALRKDAIAGARAALADVEDDGIMRRTEFAQYEERTEGKEDGSEWPYGEDVYVHAVGQAGENYIVAVRTVPGSHRKHAKKGEHAVGSEKLRQCCKMRVERVEGEWKLVP